MRHLCFALLRVVASIALSSGAADLSAQHDRVISVTVTDAQHRRTSGLQSELFEVLENGIPRPVTGFSGLDSPISLVVVSDRPLPSVRQILGLTGDTDELIEVHSLSDAVRRLEAAIHLRRTIVLTRPSSLQAVPADIRVLQVDPGALPDIADELRTPYLIRFEAKNPDTHIEVLLKQPSSLPALRIDWRDGL